jgi:uncharacterized protein with beta-barrel porin domain
MSGFGLNERAALPAPMPVAWAAVRSTVGALAIVLLTGEAAYADCTPAAANNVTATCTGTTTDQGGGAPGSSADTMGYGTGFETGVTVNVGISASITGDNSGVFLRTANVTNSGAITGTFEAGIFGTVGVTVTNGLGASISGGQGGIGGGFANVTNSGSITGTSAGSVGVFSLSDATVTNNAAANITGDKSGISAVGGFANVTNSGSIRGAGQAGIGALTTATVTNNAGGNIGGGQTGIDAAVANVTNSGSIAGGTDFGIRAPTTATVTNNAGGSITGGQAGIIAATATVTNNAGGSITGGVGIVVVGGIANIINSGSVTGQLGILATGANSSVFNAGTISGGIAAILFSVGGNTLTLGPGSVISGNVLGTGADTFQLGGTGAASFDISQIDPAAQYQGFGTFNKIDSSIWTLTGTSTFTGPVNVNGGTLAVNGDITSASGVTVNAGGTLGGTGVVGNTTVNGGTLAPGNSIGTLTVSGSLTMTAASTYLVQISGASSDMTVVTGTANLAGRVTVDPLTRISATTTYTIMIAGTVNGTFDTAGVVAGNSFARNARVSYVGNDVLLTVDPGLLSPNLPTNANLNQKNVAAGIDNALLAGANMPAGFNGLFALTGSGLANALTQASGETATGSQQSTFNAMNLFMGVMTDPFVAGRDEAANTPGAAPGYADEEALAYAAKKRNPNDALAAIYTKAPPVALFQQRWSVWAAGFGGSQTTDGNNLTGSNTATSRVYGTAIGADYRFSPFTIAGFSLAGGGTNFSVVNGGSGRSDLFQAGAFVRHAVGAAYLSGALAYGWQDVTTDRTVTIAGVDRLRAQFNANAYSGRVEGGYRFVTPWIGGVGLTPYAAGQFTTFDLPAYAESVVSGTNTFALAYSSKSVTDTRSELGVRTDKSWAMPNAILTLRGRVAWAHDFNPDRAINSTFQALPGASFTVNGARQASESALTTASIEMKWMNGWSAAGTFEGEFSDVTRSYAGKGVVRYAW